MDWLYDKDGNFIPTLASNSIGERNSPSSVYQREAKPQKVATHPQFHPQHYYAPNVEEIARKL